MLDYAAQRRAKLWEEVLQQPAEARQVGVPGLGVLGRDALEKLRPFGFRLAGWRRSPKSMTRLTCFYGSGGLDAFLAGTDILVFLLSLPAQAIAIHHARYLHKLPQRASVSQLDRGEIGRASVRHRQWPLVW